jgi:hypothetical protein
MVYTGRFGTVFFSITLETVVSEGLFIIEATRSPSDTPQSVGLHWTSDCPSQRPLPDNKQCPQETDIHAAGGIGTCNPREREASDPRLGPLGHWARLVTV